MSESDATDAALLARTAEGDEAALRELFDRHAAWLALLLQRRTSPWLPATRGPSCPSIASPQHCSAGGSPP